MSSNAFSKQQRLLKPAQFKAVFDDAPFRASHQHILMLSRSNDDQTARLGLVIAKKNIRFAVDRNRVKRLIRESFRQHQQHLYGLDVIVLARRGLAELDNEQIFKLLAKQWRRLQHKKAQQEAQS
ncbi:ribonuclease P protein component [Gilvimarinus agarilyticus]|uniref:ribonuclease P protein component n=1 Tax=unclassified Gilvimarinus TaxID=2642066 RepID=UPI001C0A43B4|nr:MULTISPECIES: ribonuclease P protein component [unclassified Gilvimarinus]MBU2884213.1 ribonuclease P protein component [Gilvimarinus agarilyticus]MDO6569352.1 ribonuclease P protein component [Gilvimarinus sp. 2_MG-2023]MDO6747506.1 ribonuclease P protein component [Gilvimarinus sp. 1_MG-2023]